MRQYKISTGRNRKDTRWKQREWTWEQLCARLEKTHRTTEKESEYHTSTRERQTEIKDIGGFVGGVVTGGRRKKGAVSMRSMLTLDIDYAEKGVWDEITMQTDAACCMYSTHSSTALNPRYRLIIPLDRDVTCEEYEAIARRIAGKVGIDQFDDSTYQAERLMFWPSTPRDGKYVYEHQDGDPLRTDAILAEYADWRDSSQWPVSSRVADIVKRAEKQQGDPLAKPGVVGRFCRAYDIHEAIDTFLSEVYQPTTNDPTRYTYMQGTTAGGLVTYDDKFAYSHHGTDPTGGQLCNAFDLVRIHLYGGLDESSRQEDVTKRPSYVKMSEVVSEDERVKTNDSAELIERLKEDYADIDIEEEEMEPQVPRGASNKSGASGKSGKAEKSDENWSWVNMLDTDKKGNVKNTMGNALLILQQHPRLKNNIRRDDLRRVDVVESTLPWRSVERSTRYWSNDDDAHLQAWMETKYGIKGKERILNARIVVATDNRYHPVRDYLHSLEWDGQERVSTIFRDYLGASDDELTREVARKVLTAAVARIMEPGCKFDYVTVLQGPEGIGKSTLIKLLAGGDEWFSDSVGTLDSDKAMEQIQGHWIIELGEMKGYKRADVESVKAFISRTTDVFRPAYGRVKETYPRQCVFFASTNEAEFLKGNTGNRRFWLVNCGTTHDKNAWELSAYDRDQIWAEAYHYWQEGEELFLAPEHEVMMRRKQEEHNEMAMDPRVGLIQEYLDKPLPVEWNGMDANDRIVYLADEDAIRAKGVNQRQYVCAAEILVECLKEKMTSNAKYLCQEIRDIMKKHIDGWEAVNKTRRFPGYGSVKYYRRIE